MKQNTVMELGDRKRVFICSPLRPGKGTHKEQQMELFRNMELASLACRYAVQHGCNPMAPHLLIPAFLDDTNPEERQTGIELGMDWLMDCDELWVIGDRISEGMEIEIDTALDAGIPVIRIGFIGDPIETLRSLVINEDDVDDEEDDDEDDEECEDESICIRKPHRCRFHYDSDEDELSFCRAEEDDDEEGLIYDGD